MSNGSKRKSQKKDSGEAKKRRSCVLQNIFINPNLLDETKMKLEFQRQLLDGEPFPHWQFPNFVQNFGGIVEDIENELQEYPEWKRKENDLYSLYQTEDFSSLDAVNYPALFSFRQFMYDTVREWLSSVSGVELLSRVDMNGSCYSETDGLLPHNDLIGTRRFAFVYYLTSFTWNQCYGGGLQLFRSDDYDDPTEVIKELVPKRNSLVIFEVSSRSWHQVSEMISNEPRLSINGWFHSSRELKPRVPRPWILPRKEQSSKKVNIDLLIKKDYIDAAKQRTIRHTFEENSEVRLRNFFQHDWQDALCGKLNKYPITVKGPPSKRCIYEVHCDRNMSNSSQTDCDALDVLTSRQFRQLIEQLTSCDLQDCLISLLVCKFQHGTYTVAGDEDAEQAKKDGFSLDVHIYVGEDEWPGDAGGEVIYIGKDDDEVLVNISPEKNSLSLVLRDPEVFSFTKYINSHAPHGSFYHLVLSFWGVVPGKDSD